MLLTQEEKQAPLVDFTCAEKVELDMNFGRRLKEARLARQMTQVDLANASGVSQTGISSLELGKGKTATGQNLFALADALRVSARWLISGEGQMDTADSERPDLIALLSDVPTDKLAALVSLIKKS